MPKKYYEYQKQKKYKNKQRRYSRQGILFSKNKNYIIISPTKGIFFCSF